MMSVIVSFKKGRVDFVDDPSAPLSDPRLRVKTGNRIFFS